MAKRYTDTLKWSDEWFLSLSNDYRIIWQWLLDNCDHAGVVKSGTRLLNFCCNTSVNEDDLKSIFKGRVYFFDDYYFIPKFLKFQYESGLNSSKPMIVSVKKILKSKKLDGLVNEIFGDSFLTIAESLSNDKRSLSNDSLIIKDKDMDMDMDMDMDIIKTTPEVKKILPGENENLSDPLREKIGKWTYAGFVEYSHILPEDKKAELVRWLVHLKEKDKPPGASTIRELVSDFDNRSIADIRERVSNAIRNNSNGSLWSEKKIKKQKFGAVPSSY